MKKQSFRVFMSMAVAAAGLVLVSAGDVQAAPFTFSCPPGAECEGSTYGLKLTDSVDLGGGIFQYEVTYGIKTTGYTGGPTDFIHAVSFKSVVSDFSDLALTSAPGGLGAWTWDDSGLQADGCKAHGEHGACAEATGFGQSVVPGE